MSPEPEGAPFPVPADWSPLEDAIKRFVLAWRQGPRPAIDEYLPASDLRHALLVELVHTELELRLKAGEPARVEEYLARYPELTTDRATVLELLVVEYELPAVLGLTDGTSYAVGKPPGADDWAVHGK